MRTFLCIFLFSLAGFHCCSAQKLDSLWKVYNNKALPDTIRLDAIHDIAWSYNSNNPDSAIILAEQEVALARASNQKKREGRAYTTIGVSFDNKRNYPKALEFYLKDLKICEETKDLEGIASCYGNVGIVFKNQFNYSKALDYYTKALKINEELGNKKEAGNCLNNIGSVYQNQGKYDKALQYYLKSLKMREESGNKRGIGSCYNNIGNVYENLSNLKKALECYLKSLEIKEETNDKQGIGICYGNIGWLYNTLARYRLSIQYGDSELVTCKEIGDLEGEREAYHILATAFSKLGRYKEAYENHVKFKTLTDSIFNTENSKQLGDLKTQFEVEKKEAELKIKAEAQEAINAEERNKQLITIYAVAGILLVVLVFSLFLFNRFRITQKQKKVIEEQKALVDKAYAHLHEKNKEVMDSIYYARRIQQALITSEKYIQSRLNRLLKNN